MALLQHVPRGISYYFQAHALQLPRVSQLPGDFYLAHFFTSHPTVMTLDTLKMGLANAVDISQAFENTSTNVAASQMRNALNKLADTVKDPSEKKVS